MKTRVLLELYKPNAKSPVSVLLSASQAVSTSFISLFGPFHCTLALWAARSTIYELEGRPHIFQFSDGVSGELTAIVRLK